MPFEVFVVSQIKITYIYMYLIYNMREQDAPQERGLQDNIFFSGAIEGLFSLAEKKNVYIVYPT